MAAFIGILFTCNFITFSMMWIDKKRSIHHRRRISEKSLILSAFLFGALGIFGGMLVFRHKTNHTKFKILIPAAIIANAVMIYYAIDILHIV